jgi:hypothetical protein
VTRRTSRPRLSTRTPMTTTIRRKTALSAGKRAPKRAPSRAWLMARGRKRARNARPMAMMKKKPTARSPRRRKRRKNPNQKCPSQRAPLMSRSSAVSLCQMAPSVPDRLRARATRWAQSVLSLDARFRMICYYKCIRRRTRLASKVSSLSFLSFVFFRAC